MPEIPVLSSLFAAPGMRRFLKRLYVLLLRPAALPDAGARRQAELLAAITLLSGGLIGGGLLAAIPNGNFTGIVILGILFVVILGCYALSRTARYQLGSGGLLITWTVITFVYAASGQTTNGPLYIFLTFIPLGFALGVALLNLRSLSWLVAANLAGVLLYPLYDPGILSRGFTTGASVLVCLGALVGINMFYRNRAEQDRLRELSLKNQELELLQRSLEQQVAELHKAQETLQAGEQMMRSFQARLKTLHEVTLELAQCESLEDLLRSAIVLGRERLGFDRLGLFLVEPGTGMMVGTFGTSTEGSLKDERQFRRPLAEDSAIMQVIQSQQRTQVWKDATLWDEGEPVGQGWNAMAAIWDGNKAIGWLAADNFIRREPLRPYIEELMLLYGATLGHLIRRKEVEESLHKLNEVLEERVAERTRQLEEVNHELESFSYSVSHDLRAPLRAINGYTTILTEDYTEALPEDGQHILRRIKYSTMQMSQLIEDLLAFSRMGRKAIQSETFDPTPMAYEVVHSLSGDQSNRQIDVHIADLPACHADPGLLRQVFVNLVGNALKYTRHQPQTIVEINAQQQDGQTVYYVRDNGAGFNMAYAGKLFGVFQRLHRQDEFEGSGVGLATAHRIITRHGGRIWAESAEGQGATFYFTLGAAP